jgi:hypothetical protein
MVSGHAGAVHQVLQGDRGGLEGAGERPAVAFDDAVSSEHAYAGDVDEDGIFGEQGAESVSIAVVECAAESID